MATTFLATVIGWYMLIVGVLVLVRAEHVKSIANDIMSNRALFFVIAIFTLIMGLLMVASHNIWVMEWSVVVTVISWIVLLSGLIRLACADTAMKMSRSIMNHTAGLMACGVVSVLIGVFLLYHVYSSHF